MSHANDLKQSFFDRLSVFRKRQKSVRDFDERTALAMDSIVLMGDMLEAYGHIGGMAKHLASPDQMASGMYCVVMNSISIEHEQLSRFLLEVHNDMTGHHEHQLLCKDQDSRNLMEWFTYHHDMAPEHLPRLWDDEGQLLHDPKVFMTTHKSTAREELMWIFKQNGKRLERLIGDLPTMPDSFRSEITPLMLDLVVSFHVGADDPRRQAILPYIQVRKEATLRLESINHSLTMGMNENIRSQIIKNFSDVLGELKGEDRQLVLDEIAHGFKFLTWASKDLADYDEVVIAYATLMKAAQSRGLDLENMFASVVKRDPSDKRAYLEALTSSLPPNRFDRYNGVSFDQVLYAAYLHLQDAHALLGHGCGAQTKMALYLLKGDESLRAAVMQTEYIDALLAHDLGL